MDEVDQELNMKQERARPAGASSTSLLVLSPRATEALVQVLLKLEEDELIFSVMNSWSRAKRWGKGPCSTGRRKHAAVLVGWGVSPTLGYCAFPGAFWY